MCSGACTYDLLRDNTLLPCLTTSWTFAAGEGKGGSEVERGEREREREREREGGELKVWVKQVCYCCYANTECAVYIHCPGAYIH